MWPPQLPDLKDRMGVSDERDDVVLSRHLLAAVAYVERELDGDFDFAGGEVDDDGDPLPDPTADVFEGAVRLAMRWRALDRSPNGLVVDLSEAGAARIPSIDADVERLLGVGRFRRPMV